MLAAKNRQKSFDSIIFEVEKFQFIKILLKKPMSRGWWLQRGTSRFKSLIAFFHAACLAFYFSL
jgi:hypothetical protein